MRLRIALVLIFSLIPNLVFANQCSKSGYTILTINGMFTTDKKAVENRDALKVKLKSQYNNENLSVDYILNSSHLAGFGDILEVAYQKYFDNEPVPDYDLTEMLSDAHAKVLTQKLLLVGHSQGNFYANSFFDLVAGQVGGVPFASIGVYGVATPSGRVAGAGLWTTSDTDQVIMNTVKRVVGDRPVKPANVHVAREQVGSSNGHSFSDIYLKYHGNKIVSDIQNSLNKLQSNDAQEENQPCLDAPESTWAHTLAKSALYIADPISSGLYETGVAVRDATSKFADNFVKFFALGNNNAASAILAAHEPEESQPDPVVEIKPKVESKPVIKETKEQNAPVVV